MIQLDRHIEILLLNNDCVIVPGLGGFMAHHVCACYYTDSQSFLPPTRQLGFNSQLQINDSLLAQSYIEAYDISYPEALRRIEDEVNELKQKIQNEGSCELNDIGVLRLNKEGNIEFIPCDAGILTPGLYGLNHIDILPLTELSTKQVVKHTSNDEKQKQDSIIPTPQPIPQLAAAKATESEIIDKEEDDYDDDSKYIKIRIKTVRRLATAAAVIAILCMCAIPFGKLTQPQISKSYLDTNILYNILPECFRVPAKNTAEKKVVFKKQPKTETKKETPKVIISVTDSAKEKIAKNEQETKKAEETKKQDETKAEEKNFFSIVLASKVTKKNAEAYVEQLKKNGFDKAEMISRTNGTKVIYGHFKSEAEAYNSLRNLRSSSEVFNEGWVMEVK